MIEVGGRILLAGVLVAASIAKLSSPRSSSAALATFGLRAERERWAAWAALIASELALAAGVAAGLDVAAYLAAAMMAVFGVVLLAALRRGRAGAPCACFGARSTVSRGAVARNLVLSFAFVALPLLPEGDVTTDQWLALGLGVALLACAGLAVAVLALAREVGMLRMAVAPEGALEIPHEGPEVGGRSALADRFEPPVAPGRIGLAVFSSEGCGLCRSLAPAVAAFGRSPHVDLRTFDEVADAGAWAAADVPGSPFAVALDPDGTVLAKGTFNTAAQLETVLAAAERRRSGLRV
jgi:hypothetical protein